MCDRHGRSPAGACRLEGLWRAARKTVPRKTDFPSESTTGKLDSADRLRSGDPKIPNTSALRAMQSDRELKSRFVAGASRHPQAPSAFRISGVRAPHLWPL